MIWKPLPILAAVAGLAAVSQVHAQPITSEEDAPSVNEVIIVAPPYLPPGAEIRQVPVSFRDLDLDSPDGGYTLLGRIRTAARQACSPPSTYPDQLADVADYQHCVRSAIGRAVDEVGAPSVEDALYEYGVGTADLGG